MSGGRVPASTFTRHALHAQLKDSCHSAVHVEQTQTQFELLASCHLTPYGAHRMQKVHYAAYRDRCSRSVVCQSVSLSVTY